MKDDYRELLHLPHHRSQTHAPMPRRDRAAQFAPFAALTGFDAQLRETERQTQAQAEPNEDALQELDQSLHTLFACVHTQPAVQVRWFVPDAKKSGGAYKAATGRVLQLDRNRSLLVLDSGPVIALGAIAELRFL